MERLLIFIKHHIAFLWDIIEWGNSILFSCFYRNKMEGILSDVLADFTFPLLSLRKLSDLDIMTLHNLIEKQDIADIKYFNPHGFDVKSLNDKLRNRSFLMMGVFESEKLVGYFFLRFFFNKKCFVGRLIDEEYRGKGIGSVMNTIMYETAWRMGFKCLSTISKNNSAVMRAHAKNPTMVVLKELQNDYLLVEFVRHKAGSEHLLHS